jgi:hypothetical protein
MRMTVTALLAIASLLSACADMGAAGTQPRATTPDDCFFARTLSDWRPLDDTHLILFASGRRPYLVELVQPATGMSFDFAIGVYDRDGRVCPYGGDSIIVDNGIGPERVTIQSMRRLSDEDLEAVYVEFGVRPPVVVESVPVELEPPED